MQFDHAEYHAASPAAAAVNSRFLDGPVPDEYHELNGKVICDTCRLALDTRFSGGSGFVRFVRAVFLGTLAAVGGCWSITRCSMTGYHLALISILVGWMVGTAVRRGANLRGGWVYQWLAIFLT